MSIAKFRKNEAGNQGSNNAPATEAKFDFASAIADMRDRNAEMKRAVRKLDDTALSARLDAMRETAPVAVAKIAALSKQINNLPVNEIKEDIKVLKEAIAKAEADMAALPDDTPDIEAQEESAIQKLDRQAKSIDLKISSLKADFDEIQEEIEELEEKAAAAVQTEAEKAAAAQAAEEAKTETAAATKTPERKMPGWAAATEANESDDEDPDAEYRPIFRTDRIVADDMDLIADFDNSGKSIGELVNSSGDKVQLFLVHYIHYADGTEDRLITPIEPKDIKGKMIEAVFIGHYKDGKIVSDEADDLAQDAKVILLHSGRKAKKRPW